MGNQRSCCAPNQKSSIEKVMDDSFEKREKKRQQKMMALKRL